MCMVFLVKNFNWMQQFSHDIPVFNIFMNRFLDCALRDR